MQKARCLRCPVKLEALLHSKQKHVAVRVFHKKVLLVGLYRANGTLEGFSSRLVDASARQMWDVE